MTSWSVDEIIEEFNQNSCHQALYRILYDLHPKIYNTLGAAEIIADELDKNEPIISDDLRRASQILSREAKELASAFAVVNKANQKILGHDRYIDLGE